jgi:hypothetical protein
MKSNSKSKVAKKPLYPNNLRQVRLSKIDPATGKPKSAEELGKSIGKGQAAMSHYEKGIRKIPSKDLGRLCEVLDCTADEIMGIQIKAKAVDHEAYELAVGAVHDACIAQKAPLTGKQVGKLSIKLYEQITLLDLNTRQIHALAVSLVENTGKQSK